MSVDKFGRSSETLEGLRREIHEEFLFLRKEIQLIRNDLITLTEISREKPKTTQFNLKPPKFVFSKQEEEEEQHGKVAGSSRTT